MSPKLKALSVLDTNIILNDFQSIFKFKTDVLLPYKIIEEVDKHKKRQDSVGYNARNFIRLLDSLLPEDFSSSPGTQEYTTLPLDDLNDLIIYIPRDLDDLEYYKYLDSSDSDNIILLTVLEFISQSFSELKYDKNRIVFYTNDINLRTKAYAFGIRPDDYKPDDIIKEPDGKIYKGYRRLYAEDKYIDFDRSIFGDETVSVPSKHGWDLNPNEYILLTSYDSSRTRLMRNDGLDSSNHYKLRLVNSHCEYISAKNLEQQFAIDALRDPNIKLVTITGLAGSGKTLLSLACGLQQTNMFNDNSKIYKKIHITRPVMPLGKDIGFLPGTVDEKMRPWMNPFMDNLEFIFNEKKSVEFLFEDGVINMEPLTFIRGRSIPNAFVICDESQNLTKHQVKTLLTRIGQNTKIVLMGDIEQIDSVYLDEINNGLTQTVEAFKDSKIAAHIHLKRGERSDIASEAAERL